MCTSFLKKKTKNSGTCRRNKEVDKYSMLMSVYFIYAHVRVFAAKAILFSWSLSLKKSRTSNLWFYINIIPSNTYGITSCVYAKIRFLKALSHYSG